MKKPRGRKKPARESLRSGAAEIMAEAAQVDEEMDPERQRIIEEVQILVREKPSAHMDSRALKARRNLAWALTAAGLRGLSKSELVKICRVSWTTLTKRLEEQIEAGTIEPVGRGVWRIVPKKKPAGA